MSDLNAPNQSHMSSMRSISYDLYLKREVDNFVQDYGALLHRPKASRDCREVMAFLQAQRDRQAELAMVRLTKFLYVVTYSRPLYQHARRCWQWIQREKEFIRRQRLEV